MANASAKKISAANQKTLTNLRTGLAVVNIIYVAWNTYRWHWSLALIISYLCTAGLTFMFYRILNAQGQSTFNPDGSLVTAGDDLNAEGLTAYMFDIIYITWFVHITTAFLSSKFWYCYLTIPAYALYKVFPFVKSFLSSRSSGHDGSPKEEGGKSKRQQKMEKRKVKYVR